MTSGRARLVERPISAHPFALALLHRVPDLVELHQVGFAKFFPAGFQLVLHQIKSPDELISCRLERTLGVELALASEVNYRKQKIADFVRDGSLIPTLN